MNYSAKRKIKLALEAKKKKKMKRFGDSDFPSELATNNCLFKFMKLSKFNEVKNISFFSVEKTLLSLQ